MKKKKPVIECVLFSTVCPHCEVDVVDFVLVDDGIGGFSTRQYYQSNEFGENTIMIPMECRKCKSSWDGALDGTSIIEEWV